MPDDWTLKLTRDEAVVLFDYLTRWQETDDPAFRDEAERVARDNLLALLETADDGTAFASRLRGAGRGGPTKDATRGVAASPGRVCVLTPGGAGVGARRGAARRVAPPRAVPACGGALFT